MSVTNLTNTKWVLNNVLSIDDDYYYNITFTSNSQQFIKFSPNYYNHDVEALFYSITEFDSVTAYEGGVWDNNAYKTIEITGGTDVTNATLIAWLEANATQQTATPKETFETNIAALNDKLNEKAGTTGQHTIAQMIDVADSISTGGGASISDGYTLTVVSNGMHEFCWKVLGTYNNVYGWHSFDYITLSQTDVITNASIMVITTTKDCDSMTSGAIVAYDGTAITTSNYNSYKNKILYLKANCTITCSD